MPSFGFAALQVKADGLQQRINIKDSQQPPPDDRRNLVVAGIAPNRLPVFVHPINLIQAAADHTADQQTLDRHRIKNNRAAVIDVLVTFNKTTDVAETDPVG